MSDNKTTFRVPSWMDNMAKTEWKRVRDLVDRDHFNAMDLSALEAYCQSYAKWKRCEITLNKEGLTFKTPNGHIQQRPEVSISNTAFTNMQSIAKEIGFTPASRIRMDKNRGDGSGGSGGGETDEELEDMIVK